MKNDFQNEEVNLGPCCVCEKKGPDVRNIMMLPGKSPTPGRGWGCAQCGLASDGASAVLCDDCMEAYGIGKAALKYACKGYPATDGRVPFGEIVGEHNHNIELHPEMCEYLWSRLGDTPIDDNECIEESFEHFAVGTFREDIWHWFEETFDVKVHDLMYGVKE